MNSTNRWRQLLDARLQPPYLVFVSGALIVVTMLMAVLQFATVNQGQSFLSTNLGADFSGFFVAAQILECGQADHLYDRELHHKLWHELLPHESSQTSIPYIHPPFVAGLLRPLTRVSYPLAVAIWLVLSASLYCAALAILLRACPWPLKNQQWLIYLLALSFEPFAFECWLGGQLSAIAFFSYALCFAALARSRPTAAGMALGICFYKPTLLILPLPLLVIGRQGKMLGGMAITGLLLAGLSFVLVGWDVSWSYVRELIQFRNSTSGGNLEIPVWKYVDLNNVLRLLLGPGSPWQWPLMVVIGFVPLVILAGWWPPSPSGPSCRTGSGRWRRW